MPRTGLNRFLFDPAPGDGAPPAGGESGTPAAPPADWRASLPEEIRTSPSLKDIRDVSDLAKGYVHAQKMIGNNVAVPTKDSKPEEWAAFFNKVGRPEAPEKYDFGKVDGEDKLGLADTDRAEYMKMAHQAGLSNRQAAQLYQWYVGSASKTISDQSARMEQLQKETEASLKKDWGDAYDQNLDLAKTALNEFGGEELAKLLEETGLGNDSRLVQMFYKIGRGMAEDKLHTQGRQGNFRMTPAEASATIGQKMSDANFLAAYNNREHPGHDAAVAEMQKLFQAKNAGA